MFTRIGLILLGLVFSFFLKDINFLGLNFSFLNTGTIYPDFLLIFLIFFALYRGEFVGLWIGFFAGLLEDSGMLRFNDSSDLFVNIIGIHALVYTVTGFTIGKVNRLINRETMLPIIVLLFFTTLIVRVIIWLIFGIVEEFYKSYPVFGPALYTAIISPLWFILLAWAYRIKGEDSK